MKTKHRCTDPVSFLVGTRVLPFAIAGITAFASPAASAISVSFEVDGLPSGLTVGVGAGFTHCPPNGTPFLQSAGQAVLTEETFFRPSTTTLPDGRVVHILVRTGTGRYLGQMTVVPPTDNGCQGKIPLTQFGYTYSVTGQNANGVPQLKTTREFVPSAALSGETVQFSDVIKAGTVSIVEGGATPTSLSKGQFHSWTVRYADAFGPDAIEGPSLEFTQHITLGAVPGAPPNPGTPGSPIAPGLPPSFAGFPGISINLSVFKIAVTGNEVCLRVGATTQCRARTAGGNLVNGNVTVDVGQTSSTVVNPERRVIFVFRLDPAFPTGSLTATATADDADLATYTVNGHQQPLNLLLWNVLQLPIAITN